MRGRTLNDAFIILDEAQNTTPDQMKMFLTRLGFGSTMVVTGDVTQVDLPGGVRSGLRVVEDVLSGVDDVEFCHLTSEDVVRHRLVGEIIEAYARWDVEKQAAQPTGRPSGRPERTSWSASGPCDPVPGSGGRPGARSWRSSDPAYGAQPRSRPAPSTGSRMRTPRSARRSISGSVPGSCGRATYAATHLTSASSSADARMSANDSAASCRNRGDRC